MPRFTDRLNHLNCLRYIIDLAKVYFNFDEYLHTVYNHLTLYDISRPENNNAMSFAQEYDIDGSIATIVWDSMLNGLAFGESYSEHHLHTTSKYWYIGGKLELINGIAGITYNVINPSEFWQDLIATIVRTYEIATLYLGYAHNPIQSYALYLGANPDKAKLFTKNVQLLVFKRGGYSEDQALRFSKIHQYEALLDGASVDDAPRLSKTWQAAAFRYGA
jgi:hypothetical protein